MPDSEYETVVDSQGNELTVGDKVLVSLGKYFAKRYLADIKLGTVFTTFDGVEFRGPNRVLIQEEGSNSKRWTYSYRVVKYDWT